MRTKSLIQIRDLAIVLAIVAGLIAIVRPAIVAAQGTGSSQLCIQNMRQLQTAVSLYTFDWDYKLPLFNQPAQLAKGIQPFTQTPAAYLLRCPVMQRPYTLNVALSGIFITAVPSDGAMTELARDAVPHTDGKSTVGYLTSFVTNGDPAGIVTYGGVDAADPEASCPLNARLFGMAIREYVQDYDETFPTYKNDTELQSKVLPYSHTSAVFHCPATGLSYVASKATSGKSASQFPSSTTKLLQDARPHQNGKITATFLDGHTVQTDQ